MKQLLSKIPKPLQIAILIIVIPIAILLIFNKTGLSKKILKIMNKEMIEENEKLKKDNNKIEEKRKQDSIYYYQILDKKIAEIEQYQKKYNNSLLIIKKYEKAINDYRTGDFRNNFVTFSKFVSNTDTIQQD